MAQPSKHFTIGVTGHRDLHPNFLEQLEQEVRFQLGVLRTRHPDRTFRLLSPLAEGADRLVARIALEFEGTVLEIPLPMSLEEYEKDFITAASLQEFRALLGRASLIHVVPALEG